MLKSKRQVYNLNIFKSTQSYLLEYVKILEHLRWSMFECNIDMRN